MRRAVVVAMVVLAGTLVSPDAAVSCSITAPEPTEAEYVAMADVVFEGVAGPHRDPNAGAALQTSGDPIFWTFTVERQIKGAVAAVQEVASARSGVSCGMTFTQGVRYRIFAKYVGGVLTTSAGSGSRPIDAVTTTTTVPAPTTTTTRPPRRITLTG